jgi:hypothetical protein
MTDQATHATPVDPAKVIRRRQAPSRSGRHCIVTGCAADPGEELLICPVHAEALRPTSGGAAA